MKSNETVLCYLIKDNQVLLLLRNKKQNDLNSNKWIGIGGHIEKEETKLQALIREVKEETGLALLNYQEHATIYFEDGTYRETMYLYSSREFEGTLIDCDEGTLSYHNIDNLKNLNMWEGDYIFLDKMFSTDIYFRLKLLYNDGVLKEAIWL